MSLPPSSPVSVSVPDAVAYNPLTPSSSSDQAAAARYKWKDDTQKLLFDLVLAEQVWSVSHGKTTAAWERIADAIVKAKGDRGVLTHRACRTKYSSECDKQKGRDRTASSRSGSTESWGAYEKLVYECNRLTTLWELSKKEEDDKEMKRANAVTQRQSELKEETMRTLRSRDEVGSSSSESSSSTPSSGGEERPAKRANIRGIAIEHNRLMELAMKQSEAQREKANSLMENYVRTVDSRMEQGNSLLASLISAVSRQGNH
jgi:hypothetical protein